MKSFSSEEKVEIKSTIENSLKENKDYFTYIVIAVPLLINKYSGLTPSILNDIITLNPNIITFLGNNPMKINFVSQELLDIFKIHSLI